MRLSASPSAALALAALGTLLGTSLVACLAAPALAAGDDARVRLAQASSPPTSGWTTPGAPQAAQPGPPASGWGPPTGPQAAPAGAPPAGGWAPPSAPAQGARPGPAASFGQPGMGGAPRRDCMGEVTPLLKDAEEKGKAIKPAAATKQQPVVCQAFRNLATAESKVIKYFEDHGAECGVPPDATKARKGNFAKIVEIRTKVCDANAAAAAKRAPSLSDALGTSRLPTTSDTPTTGRRNSTFDTLTGNPLSR